MQKIVVGNWKMHGNPASAESLARAVAAESTKFAGKAQVVICPPACLLYTVTAQLAGSSVKMGGQNCHEQPEGAYTGDISAPMMKDAGCQYVIVGHSERRQYHHERNIDIRHKAARVIKTGMTPIICIGETEAEHETGKTREILSEQIRECIPEEAIGHHFILAYEPVWAIGSGKTPTLDDIRQIHAYIITMTARRTGLDASRIQVLYGGSVKAANAGDIMQLTEVAGVLVGGASLKAEEFCAIIKSAIPA